MQEKKLFRAEQLRIRAEYDRREVEIEPDLYAPWQSSEILMTSERKRVASTLLNQLGRFPRPGDRCLEVGYGKLGWLADMISWGLRETDLYGIELDPKRAEQARRALPGANLEIGDATQLPWNDEFFDFVIVSTVLSSILNHEVRKAVADEIGRVLPSGGVVILYDAAVNNPKNQNLLHVRRKEIKTLFPHFSCRFQSTTLAPPVARFVSTRSWVLATILSGIPLLRTHFVCILVKL